MWLETIWHSWIRGDQHSIKKWESVEWVAMVKYKMAHQSGLESTETNTEVKTMGSVYKVERFICYS